MPFFPTFARLFPVAALAALTFGFDTPALASGGPHRGITLPDSQLELELGLGLAHVPNNTGLGANLALNYGLSSNLELGLRTGLRFGPEGRTLQADSYGRTFELESHGAGSDALANPELLLRGGLSRGTVDLALEGRAYLPVDNGSRFGMMLGLPLQIDMGRVELHTGLYVPLWFGPTKTLISVPATLWIDAGSVYVGPMVAYHYDPDTGADRVPFGFGLGKGLGGNAELRAWFLIPDISGSGSARSFGLGTALALTF